jgi:hypothetical protein
MTVRIDRYKIGSEMIYSEMGCVGRVLVLDVFRKTYNDGATGTAVKLRVKGASNARPA